VDTDEIPPLAQQEILQLDLGEHRRRVAVEVKQHSSRARSDGITMPTVQCLTILGGDAELSGANLLGDPSEQRAVHALGSREDHLTLKSREQTLCSATTHELPCEAMSGIMKTVAALLALGLMACGGSKSADSKSTGKVSAIEAMGITPPDSPWEEMSVEDREFYMIGKVNPIMKELFAGYDAEEFGDFDCVHCHGEEMREIDFKMPAPSMYIVPPEGTPGHRGMLSTFPDEVKFMQEVVTPSMAKLLGIENFSCAGCHPSAPPKKKTAKPKR
jgi:hypothetical protein